MAALRCALAAMLLWGVSAQARDIVITPTKSEYVSGGVRYYFVVNSWGYEFMSSPCSTTDPFLSTCTIYLNVRVSSSDNTSVGRYRSWEVPVRPNSYMRDLLRDLESTGFRIPLSGSIFVASEKVSSNLCIGFSSVKTGPIAAGVIEPLGPCYRVAAPSLQCDITGYAVIDHKSLMDNAVDGATASTQVYVQCHGPASLAVSTSRTDSYGVRLKSDGSLYSKITVNGQDATAGINVPITQGLATPLTITSTLVKRGNVTPGQFSGSTVVTISPP